MISRISKFIFVFLILPFITQGQAIYNGNVRDVASGQFISDADVELLYSDIKERSNIFGDFVLKNQQIDTIAAPVNSYKFYNNALIWDGELDVGLEIFAINGQAVASENSLGTKGSYIFPNLPVGVYVVLLRTKSDQQSFKAFSNGLRTHVADKSAPWHRSSVIQTNDTLLVSKHGYYSRKIPMFGTDSLIDVFLLKKTNDELHYFNELIDRIAYELISDLPSRSNDGQVEAVKVIYNEEDGLMYYMNTKRYKLHSKFAEVQLNFKGGNNIFNQTQYREGEDRFLYPGNINYYKDLDKYVLHIVAGNEMPCDKVKLLYDKIIATSYLKGKLFLLGNRLEFNDCDVPIITTEELYAGQNYQALNLAENYGYLTQIEIEDLADTYVGRHDIVLLNAVPNDVSVVAGIITTEFQTPLSHINVLSHNRGTPNMALRDGWENPLLQNLIGELVYLRVQADSFEIRKANLTEATTFWNQNEPQDIIELNNNTDFNGLVELVDADFTWVDRIGGKASNFGEMLNVQMDNGSIPVPESAFAIPFYYYDQHIKSAGLDSYIPQLLSDNDFINSPEIRKDLLKDLRNKIKDHPIDPDFLNLVENRIKNFQDFPSFRFRSSTNAEDLENFSGAGLYSSYSAKQNDPDKTIEEAIKKVWASLWNWRAFEERSYYKIVHTTCSMGILVQRSFPDEDANGVVITKNLYNSNPGMIVNVQYKEYSIVFPEPGILSDQLILFTWSIDPGEDFSVEYLTFSNVPELNGQHVLTNEELFELGEYCVAIRKHFFNTLNHNCQCQENEFGLDIEFKVDSAVANRKIYIKQARLYN